MSEVPSPDPNYPGNLFSEVDEDLGQVPPENRSEGSEEVPEEVVPPVGPHLPNFDLEETPETTTIETEPGTARDYNKEPMTDAEFDALPEKDKILYRKVGRPGTPSHNRFIESLFR